MAEKEYPQDENKELGSPSPGPGPVSGAEESREGQSEDPVSTLGLDLGDEQTRTTDPTACIRLGRQQSTNSVSALGAVGCDVPKREDNPFSFKHFLQNDSSSFQNKGARPKAKVYCDGRPINSISDINLLPATDSKPTRIVPEFSSALPDFVQDHLIVEQCYLGNPAANFDLDINNLPDFAPNRAATSRNNVDLNTKYKRVDNSEFSIPLDLPVRPQAGFPLDLPLSGSPQQNNSRNSQAPGEVGVSKSLPDFLTDGAVHGQNTDSLPVESSPERDNERLRQELEEARRQLADQTRRADMLSMELESLRNKEQEYTQNLVKALEQVEDNLEKSNRRASSAECTIVKLRQEIKSLTIQISHLKIENEGLRQEEGAVGGAGYFNAQNELQYQRVAQELRNAASSAELSLRQLLTGVDNLRIMAASLENMHRIEEKDESYMGLDDETGPAL